jgi:hypothetical protein
MAPALLFALALFAADPAMDTAGSGSPAATLSPGEPQNDYQLVAWCYGALAAHMSLHDEAMPEVERIERTFETHPGAAKEELAFYAQQQKEGKKQLALFREAMTAAEKASIKPIQQDGAAAMAQGKAIWAAAGYTDKRRLAQEWMSWALPDRCSSTAQSLEKKASVLGAAISYNAESEAPAAPAAEAGSAPAEEPAAAPAEEPAAPAAEEPAATAEDAASAEAPAAEEAPAPSIDGIIDGDDAASAEDDQEAP